MMMSYIFNIHIYSGHVAPLLGLALSKPIHGDTVSNFVIKILRLLRLPTQFDVDTTFGVCPLLQRVSTMHTRDWHLCVQLVLSELSRARFVGFSAERAPRVYVFLNNDDNRVHKQRCNKRFS
jgi:hypothetical protein